MAQPGPARGIFRREGEYWTISYGGTMCRLRDTAGLRYLASLLRRAGQKVPALELVQARQLALERHTRAVEKQSLLRQRARFTITTHAGELARVTSTRSIRTAVQRIAVHNPQLGEHLTATIKTGTCCAYTPDARLLVAWDLDTP